MERFDAIVIGGGPAGYNSAEYAAHRGQKVLLIEKANLGGTCLNVGCVPTKIFLYAAKMLHYASDAGEAYGVTVENTKFEHVKAVEKKDEVVRVLTQGIAGRLSRNKVKVVNGEASVDKDVDGILVSAGGETFAADHLIIATGSAPTVPPIEGVAEGLCTGEVLTSNELLSIKEVPDRLVIVGGGVIGFEMAAYFREAGSEVTVIEMLDKVLGSNDKEVSRLLQKDMEKKGVVFHLSSSVTEIKDGRVCFTKNGVEETVPYDKVLMCVGRKANSQIEGLESLGIQTERGAIVTNERMQTNVPGVYAVGDVNGKVMLAHVGYREGEVAVNNILGADDAMSYKAICGIVYTNPEAAFVGISEEQAKAAGLNYSVKKVSINCSGRHFAENGMSKGICKILVDNDRDRIVGAAIMSSYASEYIYSLALMIQNRIPVKEIVKTVFPHPTVCEVIREALLS